MLAHLILIVATLVHAAANAQATWPNRPVTIISPAAPGGSNDIVARMLANKLAARLGQPVVVENKGGAGGTLGNDAVAKAAPDGHTLLMTSVAIATNAGSGKKLPYDTAKDFEPIALVATTPLLVVVAYDSKFRTLRELLDHARAKPDGISYGSAGIGGINHLAVELLAAEAKVRMVHIPYKGITPAMSDLIAGNVQMLISSPASALAQIQAGKVRGIAVTSAQRSSFSPEIPTIAESGFPGFQVESWWAVLGRARMPPEVVKRLNEEINAVVTQPDVRDMLAREGATPKPSTPGEVGRLLRFELSRWSKLIKDANIMTE